MLCMLHSLIALLLPYYGASAHMGLDRPHHISIRMLREKPKLRRCLASKILAISRAASDRGSGDLGIIITPFRCDEGSSKREAKYSIQQGARNADM